MARGGELDCFQLFFQHLLLGQVGVVAAGADQFGVRPLLHDRPRSSTTIRSAWRTVETRCEIRITVRPRMTSGQVSAGCALR